VLVHGASCRVGTYAVQIVDGHPRGKIVATIPDA